MGWAAEPGYIQVLSIQLDIEELVRPKGRSDALVGQFVGRMRLILAVEDQDCFRLFGLRRVQWLHQEK